MQLRLCGSCDLVLACDVSTITHRISRLEDISVRCLSAIVGGTLVVVRAIHMAVAPLCHA